MGAKRSCELCGRDLSEGFAGTVCPMCRQEYEALKEAQGRIKAKVVAADMAQSEEPPPSQVPVPAAAVSATLTPVAAITADVSSQLRDLATYQRVSAWAWLLIGILQLSVGVLMDPESGMLLLIIPGLWNLGVGVSRFQRAREIEAVDPRVPTMVERELGSYIFFIILNLLLGAIIGVVGAVVDLIIRSAILRLRAVFEAQPATGTRRGCSCLTTLLVILLTLFVLGMIGMIRYSHQIDLGLGGGTGSTRQTGDWSSMVPATLRTQHLIAKLDCSDLAECDKHWTEITQAIDELVAIGEPAVPSLAKVVQSQRSVPQRILAAMALQEMGPAAVAARPALQAALKDQSATLEQPDGGGGQTQQLLDMYSLFGQAHGLKAWSANALSTLGPDGVLAVPALREAAFFGVPGDATDEAVRSAARNALAELTGVRGQAEAYGLYENRIGRYDFRLCGEPQVTLMAHNVPYERTTPGNAPVRIDYDTYQISLDFSEPSGTACGTLVVAIGIVDHSGKLQALWPVKSPAASTVFRGQGSWTALYNIEAGQLPLTPVIRLNDIYEF